MRSAMTMVLVFVFSSVLNTVQPAGATLINHYSFNNGSNLGEDSSGTRDMTEQTIGGGGTLSQEASVTDVNGLLRTDVLRIAGRTPTATNNATSTTVGSFLSHDTTTSTLLANYTVSMWIRSATGSPGHPDNTGFFSTGPGTTTNDVQLETGIASNPDWVVLNGRNSILIIDGDGGGESGLVVNDWTHVSLTYDGATARFYVDGQEFGSAAGNPGNEFQIQRIGSNRASNRLYQGTSTMWAFGTTRKALLRSR